jgi:hypothetical protein
MNTREMRVLSTVLDHIQRGLDVEEAMKALPTHDRAVANRIMQGELNTLLGSSMETITEATPTDEELKSDWMHTLLEKIGCVDAVKHRLPVKGVPGEDSACTKNCKAILRERGGEILKGFKVFRTKAGRKEVGGIAIIHFVVRLPDGKIIDETPSSNDHEILWVESPRLYDEFNMEVILRDGVRHGVVIHGTDQFVKFRRSVDEEGGELLFDSVRNCVPKVCLKNEQTGTLRFADVREVWKDARGQSPPQPPQATPQPPPGEGRNAKKNKKKKEKKKEKKAAEKAASGEL